MEKKIGATAISNSIFFTGLINFADIIPTIIGLRIFPCALSNLMV